MTSSPTGKSQDHYQVLHLHPKADSDAIQKAYTRLIARFHPSNTETGDEEKFQALNQAYGVLSDPAARQAYDTVRCDPGKEAPSEFNGPEFFSALAGEVLRRQCVLCLLYNRRRKKPLTPSLSIRDLETMINASSDEIQFSIWYLKQKGQASSDDKSNIQITVQGMEYLERDLPDSAAILALLRQAGASTAEAGETRTEAAHKTPEPLAPPLKPPVGASGPQPRTFSLPRRTIVVPPRQ